MSKWYRTGTVTVVANSALVVGVGTYWKAGAVPPQAGDMLVVNNQLLEIAKIIDDNNLELETPYKAESLNSIEYGVVLTASGTSSARVFSAAQTVLEKLGNRITVSTSAPVAGQGNDGDIIIVAQA